MVRQIEREPAHHVAEKISEAIANLWHNSKEYREKTLRGIKSRQPPAPEKTKRRLEASQQGWNKKHGMEENADLLTRRGKLFEEWLRITTQELGHSPSLYKIDRLRKGKKTQFSATMYRREFGGKEKSFAKAKQVLGSLVRVVVFLTNLQENPSRVIGRHVFEKDINKIASEITAHMQDIFSTESQDEIEKRTAELEENLEILKKQLLAKSATMRVIGKDERSMWEQIKKNNLETKLVQAGIITKEELGMIDDYFQRKIVREGLRTTTFDRLAQTVVVLVKNYEL